MNATQETPSLQPLPLSLPFHSSVHRETESISMRQVPLERDINIAVNGCSGFATSTQKGLFMAMLISRSRGTYLIDAFFL